MGLDISGMPTPVQEALRGVGAIPDAATVRTAFGEPIRLEGRTLIPVARVGHAFGMGYGGGEQKGRPAEDAPAAAGSGGGGGGGLRVTPIAVIEVTAEQMTIRPIIDVARVALLGAVLMAWNIFWVTRTIREVARWRARSGDEA